uniref:Sodium/calcium exchanger membrane region domain-containing protein n=1 Tax=Gossypium raimondii TaxID=29730 RepID=A0A0D2TLB8_GOSRA|nr:hypothetical protein B456_007G254300 [Gossypium raimondii]
MMCFRSSRSLVLSTYNSNSRSNDYKAKCSLLKSNNPCVSQGYVDYLHLFYCNFGKLHFYGHSLLILWLLMLFYLLGNTTSEYFCYSIESLSSLLKLSPTLVGVTLLSLSNGAPDVFSSAVSFMDSGTQDIALNTVLGGAFVYDLCCAFVRYVCFLLLVLSSLTLILIYGRINHWGSLAFSSMYIVYVILVYIIYTIWNSGAMDEICSGSYKSILTGIEKEEIECLDEGMWKMEMDHMLFWILQTPLNLPRRFTIPRACKDRWSKPVAVVSVTLAPILISVLWDFQDDSTGLMIYGIGCLFGLTFWVLAYLKTEKSSPADKCLFSCLAEGFIMSVIWSYITAQELVGLLISLGYILGISHTILGLTALAWGNSLGDLITNLTMALNGGPQGAQVALSGCYAGPIFNTLFGLGLSLFSSTWCRYPSPVKIPKDPYLLEPLGFLIATLIWTLLVLPMKDMRLDGVLGGGLFLIYFISMSLRLVQVVEPLQLHTFT